jgi:hypothetical protein
VGEFSESVASASTLKIISCFLQGFLKLGKIRNVSEPDVIVYFILDRQLMVVFSSFLDPSQSIRLVLGDSLGHDALNL